MFLNVRVSAETYPEIMREIKHTHALVVVVVDLFDMKNSVFKDLLKYVGRNRPLFIVGNKVDLLPMDKTGAKTGYGIEQLVTTLMLEWPQKGHVYVVGSTNVGKSTLFNALLMSDYCKSLARGFINRATVSVWPGTTLNLLKFPIVNPSGRRLELRAKRLQKDSEEWEKEEMLRKSRLAEVGSYKHAVLTGHIGLTDFRDPKKIQEDMDRESEGQDILSFSQSAEGQVQEVSGRHTLPPEPAQKGYKPEGFPMYWCNDTPGVVNPEQIINLLEPEELMTVLPKSLIQPVCVVIKPGQVLFVSGLGRIDFVQGSKSIYLTVHAAYKVPVHVKEGHEADAFYQEAFGTEILGVPLGNADRLQRMPALVGREFQVTGVDWEIAAADIQLSSLVWNTLPASIRHSPTLSSFKSRLKAHLFQEAFD
nr:hypothetical protein BaRGS_032223 [Batillaria attramentaria]